MRKPENITQTQWDHLMSHLEATPKIEVRQEGTFESRMLVTPEMMKTRGAKNRRGTDAQRTY